MNMLDNAGIFTFMESIIIQPQRTKDQFFSLSNGVVHTEMFVFGLLWVIYFTFFFVFTIMFPTSL